MTNDTPQRVARGVKRHGSRYKARRRAVDLLFEGEARDVDPVLLAQERSELATDPDNQVAPVNDYTLTIVDGVAVQLDALDDVIERYLTDDWELHRIPAVDRAILRLSVWELLFNPDVPSKTAVVEGTELASQYSGEQAARYINALLDAVRGDAEELRAVVSVVPSVPGDTAPSVDSGVGEHSDSDATDCVDIAGDAPADVNTVVDAPEAPAEPQGEAAPASDDSGPDVHYGEPAVVSADAVEDNTTSGAFPDDSPEETARQ